MSAAAILGGTISQITGGKFANGASAAAFGQAFNGEVSRRLGVMERRAYLEKLGIGAISVSRASSEFRGMVRDGERYKSTLPTIAGRDIAHQQRFQSEMIMMMGGDKAYFMKQGFEGLLLDMAISQGKGTAIRISGSTWVDSMSNRDVEVTLPSETNFSPINSVEDLIRFYATETPYFERHF